MTPGYWERVDAVIRESRTAQGLPPVIEDGPAIRQIASVLAPVLVGVGK